MFKKFTALLLAGIVSVSSLVVFAADPRLDVAPANERGIVTGTADATIARRTLFRVDAADGRNYVYVVRKNEDSGFPLQMGNGTYSLRVMEQVEGTKFRTVSKEDVSLNLRDSRVVFNQSIQNIAWTKDSEAAKKAAELVRGKTTADDKIKAIYDFITRTIVYDFDKIDRLTSDYIPSPDATLREKKGICYDYSALFAAMLRSQGISAKLIKGHTDLVDVYHAWNEVYLESQGKWVVIDTTVDAAFIQAGQRVDMFKDPKLYRMDKEF
jgi:transglutaminase/protease-like cytokinesis protein 3